MIKFLVILLVFRLVYPIESVNILVLENLASKSDHLWIKTITSALVQQGNNVTWLSAIIDADSEEWRNLNYIQIENIHTWVEQDEHINSVEYGRVNSLLAIQKHGEYVRHYCNQVVKSKGFHRLLNYPDDFKFDLIIYDFASCPILAGFVHKFNYPPLISLSATNIISDTQPHTGTILHPVILQHHYFRSIGTSFLARVQNYIIHIAESSYKEMVILPHMDFIAKIYFPGMMSIKSLLEMSRIVLLNMDPVTTPVHPIYPNIIPVGGLHIVNSTRGLPEGITAALDKAEAGVMILSFGYGFRYSDLGTHKICEILRAVESIPDYTVLWMLDLDAAEIACKVPRNVLLLPRMHQIDVFSHEKIKLFITSGDLLDIQESVWHGVPILGLPILVKQFTNIEKMCQHGAAELFDIEKLDSETFTQTMLEMFLNPQFKSRMKVLSNIFRDQRETALERGLWWLQLVVQKSLPSQERNASVDLTTLQRQSIDVIVAATAILLLILVSIVTLLFWHCRNIANVKCTNLEINKCK